MPSTVSSGLATARPARSDEMTKRPVRKPFAMPDDRTHAVTRAAKHGLIAL